MFLEEMARFPNVGLQLESKQIEELKEIFGIELSPKDVGMDCSFQSFVECLKRFSFSC